MWLRNQPMRHLKQSKEHCLYKYNGISTFWRFRTGSGIHLRLHRKVPDFCEHAWDRGKTECNSFIRVTYAYLCILKVILRQHRRKCQRNQSGKNRFIMKKDNPTKVFETRQDSEVLIFQEDITDEALAAPAEVLDKIHQSVNNSALPIIVIESLSYF